MSNSSDGIVQLRRRNYPTSATRGVQRYRHIQEVISSEDTALDRSSSEYVTKLKLETSIRQSSNAISCFLCIPFIYKPFFGERQLICSVNNNQLLKFCISFLNYVLLSLKVALPQQI